MSTPIDHIVYAVPDLHKAIKALGKKLGVEPVYGGKHQTFGTHNALVGLGKGCYLELLAADQENTDVFPPRWMGVDIISKPTITRWAIVSDDIDEQARKLQNINPDMGHVQQGMRRKTDGSLLRWKLAMPLPKPEVEVIPFILDWQGSIHPSHDLENTCSIHSFSLGHPNARYMSHALKQAGIEADIQESEQSFIKLQLKTPNGIVDL